jgi:hypothetical protein
MIRRIIREEWVTTLGDLAERRLMLLYDPQLDRLMLEGLAQMLVEEGKLAYDQIESTVESCVSRLRTHYGRTV